MCQQKAEKQLPTYTQGTIRPAQGGADTGRHREQRQAGRHREQRQRQTGTGSSGGASIEIACRQMGVTGCNGQGCVHGQQRQHPAVT